MSWIQTFTGRKFDVLNPRAEDVCWLDIAHSLAHQCRFNGHTKQFYSVAHHSVLASQHVPERFALRALLHDAAEAYIGDMPKPVKEQFPEFSIMEDQIMAAVHEAADLVPMRMLPFEEASEIDLWVSGIDNRLLMTERDQLMAEPPEPWFLDHPDLRPEPVPVEICCEPDFEIYKGKFLRRLVELGVEVQMTDDGGQRTATKNTKTERLGQLPGAIRTDEQLQEAGR